MTDLQLLEAILEHEDALTETELDAFDGMCATLRTGRFSTMTAKQKGWAEEVAARLGIDPGASNMVSTGAVRVRPEEREGVATFLKSLGPLPLKPPGRR